MNAATAPTLDELAAATYAAMIAPPAHVGLAHALLAATTKAERGALLDGASATDSTAALRYLAEPEATRERTRRLEWARTDARRIAALKRFYASNIDKFISEYAWTTDPRLIAAGKPAQIPFVLWPRQIELVSFLLECWRTGSGGTVKKSRDIGASYVSMAVLGSLCLFHDNFVAGVGSQTEAKCDQTGNPSTLLHKLREFMSGIPAEFSNGWSVDRNSAHMRVSFNNGSAVVAEAGDQIGRSARFAFFVLDEAGFIERPALIDASLSAATTCRVDVSSVNGTGNSYYERCLNAAIPMFEFHWRSDPRKGDEWYAKQVATLDPVVVASEIDMDFHASTRGAIIPSAHVQAAIDLHLKLGITPTGVRRGALDVADEGKDRCAFAVRHGQLLESVESWSGRGGDIYSTTQRAFALCDEHELREFRYDADGLGAGIRGDARALNEKRTAPDPETKRAKAHSINAKPYRGSAPPEFPNRKAPRTPHKNIDFYANAKAQAWHHLAMMFRESDKAARGEPYDPELIICIDSRIADLSRLISQLSQATAKQSASGKLLVDKLGDGEKSPDMADAVVIVFAERHEPLNFSQELLARI
jgi:phage terminase large subunit